MSQTADMPETIWSEEAELSCLAVAVMTATGAERLVELLEPTDFYIPSHGQIFAGIREMLGADKAVDPVTLSEHCRGRAWFSEMGGSAFLHTLAAVPALLPVREYARIVKDHARRRDALQIADKIREGRLEISEAAEALNNLVTESARALPFITGLELARDMPEELEPVWTGYLYRGTVAELSGGIKKGKTSFALALAEAVVTGDSFIETRTVKSPVLYLTEQNRPSFAAGLDRARLSGCPDLHLLFRHEYRAEWPTIALGARRHALEVGAGLVVVDTLHEWANMGRDDENNAGAALAAMRPLHEIAAAGPAVLVLRHERKGGGEIGENSRGSTVFGGSADVLLVLRLPKGQGHETRRELEVAGRLHDKTTVTIELRDGRYELLGDRSDIERHDCRELLLEALPAESSRALTEEDLLDRIDGRGSRSTVQRILGELVDSGQATRAKGAATGHPRAFAYWLAEVGR